MIYTQINSKLVVASLFDRFNIDYSGFIPRVPNWIHAAIRELDIYVSLIDDVVDGTVSNYKCAIPSEAKALIAVSYLGVRLPRTDTLNMKDNSTMDELSHDYHSYELTGDGYIVTTFEECEEGELRFYIKKLATVLDSNLNIYFPLIPDNQDLITALEWYILKRLLERGHRFEQFSLTANNEFTNPALAWEKWKRIARISVSRIDADEREQLSRMKCTLLTNKYYYSEEQFNMLNNE